jgi:hypothetical protein
MTVGVMGTSFASPLLLRTAVGLKAHYGKVLSPLSIKALLIHHAKRMGQSQIEVGWGRTQHRIQDIITCREGTVKIIYQGELRAAKYLRAPIPVPTQPIDGKVEITATFCFTTDTDPGHMPNYTRSGLDIKFRPHKDKYGKDPLYPKTDTFFTVKDMYEPEISRRKGGLWETVLHRSKRKYGSSYNDPVFDIHYNARIEGQGLRVTRSIPYALVITVEAPSVPDLYDQVRNKYRGLLHALEPIIEVPVRIQE